MRWIKLRLLTIYHALWMRKSDRQADRDQIEQLRKDRDNRR